MKRREEKRREEKRREEKRREEKRRLKIGTIIVLILFLCVSHVDAKSKKSSNNTAKNEYVLNTFLLSMDSGMISKSLLQSIKKLAKRAQAPNIKMRAIALLAQYAANNDSKGIRDSNNQTGIISAFTIVTPHILDKKSSKIFLKNLRAIKRTSKQIKNADMSPFISLKVPSLKGASTHLNDGKPSASTASRDSINDGKPSLSCTLAFAKLLAFIGKDNEAFQIIDAVGRKFSEVPRVIAAELLGDIQYKQMSFLDSIKSYNLAMSTIKYMQKSSKNKEDRYKIPLPTVIKPLQKRIQRKKEITACSVRKSLMIKNVTGVQAHIIITACSVWHIVKQEMRNSQKITYLL